MAINYSLDGKNARPVGVAAPNARDTDEAVAFERMGGLIAMPTINDLSVRAGELARSMNARAGLNPHSPMVFALTSGFDVGLTLLEQSTGTDFSDLSAEKAVRVIKYFEDEAERSAAADMQIAIFYRSWAQVLSATYIDR